MSNLYLGVAREIITPDIGGQLYGYRPDVFSDSVEDDLTATAFYFEKDNLKAIMLSVTVCSVQTLLAESILNEISKKTDVPKENIILSCTHTHSAPNTTGNFGWGDIDRKYCKEIFVPKIISACEKATKNTKLVTMYASKGESKVGINRRELVYNRDTVRLGQNKWGPFNPNMSVISFKDENGNTIANMIYYGCHGTAAGTNTEITRDWSGIMTDTLEKETGGITAFFNGAEGDVGPRISNGKTTGDLTYVYELGKIAAEDSLRIYKDIKEENIDFTAKSMEVKIPLKPRMKKDDALKLLEDYKGQTVNLMGKTCHTLENIINEWENGVPEKTHLTFLQTMIKLGNFVFVSFPFEIFSEISLRIDSHYEDLTVLSLSNTNGSEGYFVTEDAICRGGYEIRSFIYGHNQSYEENADLSLITATIDNINNL